MAKKSAPPGTHALHGHTRTGQGSAYDTSKHRSQWFLQRATFPLRDAPPVSLEKFWQHQESYPHIHHLNWEEAGPVNYAGRVTSLVVDPTDSRTLYAGAAAGGVWKSTDGGRSWRSSWPDLLNQNIGALAIHPVDGTQLYCATGEGNLSADSYPGSGIYYSSDGGLTWLPVFTMPQGDNPGEDVLRMLPRRVGTIAFGRSDGQNFRIALGAVSKDESLPAALYLDEGDFGLQPNTFWGIRSYNCYSVVFHPDRPGLIYVAIQPRGTANGMWRSQDFGKSWTHLTNGLPRGEECARISLAISPSQPNILYAQVSSLTHGVLGIFRTANGGDVWHEIGGDHFKDEGQMSYNNTIAVDPNHPNRVVCGGLNLHMTTDGGRHWTEITTGMRGDAGDPFPANFVHNDHHALVITREGLIYSGNDGGVAVSEDGGETWQDRSHGMVTAMFYAADVAQTNSNIFGGGTQDNGTLLAGVPDAPYDVPGPREFTRVLPGDGGWLQIDPTDEEHVFGSTSDLILSRHRRGEPWAHGRQLAAWKNVSISPDRITSFEKGQRAISVMEIEPGRPEGKRKVWVGTGRLWCTADDGRSWKPVSPFFDGSAVSAIEVSSADPRFIYVGTSNGGIFRSMDGGVTWSANLAAAVIPERVVTRIATHPKSAITVVITVASTAMTGTALQRTGPGGNHASPDEPFCHVFQSDDMCRSWRALDGRFLPNVVYNAIVYETRPPYRLFAGGDAGVWVSTDIGADGNPEQGRWAACSGNMPNVIVSDLVYHDEDQILLAATYGRGIWRLNVAEPLPPVTIPGNENIPQDAPMAVGLIRSGSIPAPVLVSPADGATFGAGPRTVKLEWEPVPGAVVYTVVVDSKGSPTFEYQQSYSSVSPSLTFSFWTEGEGHWRVWAILPHSRRSPASEKRTFTFNAS